MSRSSFKISKVSNEYEAEDAWLKRFETSVNNKSAPNKNLYQQILSVMNGNSKYSSVDAAVKDMQERSGLTAFISQKNSSELNESKKTAQDNGCNSKIQQAITTLVNEYPGLNYAAALDKLEKHFHNDPECKFHLTDDSTKEFLVEKLKSSITTSDTGNSLKNNADISGSDETKNNNAYNFWDQK